MFNNKYKIILMALAIIATSLHMNANEISLINSSDTCNSTNEGAIRYVSATKTFEGCDGSSWDSLGGSDSSMLIGWPDAIICNMTSPNWNQAVFYPKVMPYIDGKYYYQIIDSGSSYQLAFNSDGNFSGYAGISASNCNKSISQLYTDGQAFNFSTQ